jgi:hypothetical protein
VRSAHLLFRSIRGENSDNIAISEFTRYNCNPSKKRRYDCNVRRDCKEQLQQIPSSSKNDECMHGSGSSGIVHHF